MVQILRIYVKFHNFGQVVVLYDDMNKSKHGSPEWWARVNGCTNNYRTNSHFDSSTTPILFEIPHVRDFAFRVSREKMVWKPGGAFLCWPTYPHSKLLLLRINSQEWQICWPDSNPGEIYLIALFLQCTYPQALQFAFRDSKPPSSMGISLPITNQ